MCRKGEGRLWVGTSFSYYKTDVLKYEGQWNKTLRPTRIWSKISSFSAIFLKITIKITRAWYLNNPYPFCFHLKDLTPYSKPTQPILLTITAEFLSLERRYRGSEIISIGYTIKISSQISLQITEKLQSNFKGVFPDINYF